MPLDNIVNVQITRETQSVSEMGFGTLMILGTNKAWNDLYRQYSSLQEVAVDFQPYTPEYIAAQNVFAQAITPPFIYIGRRTVDTVDIEVETALPSQTYTTTINGTPVSISSSTAVKMSTVTLSGIVTSVIQFSSDFNSASSILATINGLPLSPVVWNTDQATTIAALATEIETSPAVQTATVTAADQITVTFYVSSSAIVNSVITSGTGSQPTNSISYLGPIVTGNLINVSLNGTIVGTVTSIIDFDIDFVTSNSAVATVNGVALTAVPFNTNQATTIGDLATEIATASGVTSATVTGTKEITVVFTSPGNNTVNSVITTGGASQPIATISEGGFPFDANNLTTMDDIATAIGLISHITSAIVSGPNNNVLTITSESNYPGVIDFFTVTLGASQATTAIVNTPQPTSGATIASAMVTAINSASLGVTAAIGSPTNTYSLTANVAGVPYTVEVSTTITNPDACRVVITQAIPNQYYTVKINGTSFTYQAPYNVATNEQIASGLVALINASTSPVPVSATDNGNGTFEVDANVVGTPFLIQVFPFEVIQVQKGLIIGPYIPSAAVVTDLQAIQAVNDDWYALACTDRTSATVQAIGAWIESQVKIFGTASDDLNIINEPAGTDLTSIAAIFNNAGYARSFVMYHQDADEDYPECAWFGNCLPLIPGSETWKFKKLNSIAYSDLSTNQETNAFNKNCNTYEYIGGVGITQNGTMAVGEFIDIIRGVDWLTSTIQTYVYSTLVNSPKVPYTDTGITAIQSQIMNALQLGITNGFIAETPPFVIMVPLAASVSPTDKVNRILRNVSFTATLVGAIQAVQITGTVSV